MEHNIINNELEQMREQIALLRRKLDKETIISEQLLRRIMHDKVRGITRDNRTMIICGSLAIPYTAIVFNYLGMSLSFSIATCILLAVSVLATLWMQRDLQADELLYGDVVSAGKKMLRFKQMNDSWLWYSIPLLVAWLLWFFWEAYQQIDGTPLFNGFVIGAIVGIFIGGIIGGVYRSRMKRRIREVLAHIEELTRE